MQVADVAKAIELVTGYFREPHKLDRRAYISNAKIDLALSGLELFFAAYGEGIFPETTPAQLEGRRLHMATLEPEEWRKVRCVHRFQDFRSPEAKAWLLRIERENPGAVIMNHTEDLRYQRIVDRILSHRRAGQLIRESATELYGYARCPRTGMILHSRPDIRTKSGWIGDLKFVRNIDDFNREQFRQRWFMQLAFYNFVEGLITGQRQSGNCFWIAVEIKYPHRIAVLTMESDYEKMGDVLWNDGLDRILECLERDPQMKNFEVWRAHSNKAREIKPEVWMVQNDQRFVDAISVGG